MTGEVKLGTKTKDCVTLNHTFFLKLRSVFNKRAYYVTSLSEKGKKNPYFLNTQSTSCLRKSICNIFWSSYLLSHFSRFTTSFKHYTFAAPILGNIRESKSSVIPSLIVHPDIYLFSIFLIQI